ncbi:MAG: hypothetical protein IPN26_15950 [Bacteroidetes bacterium]|nr:hypothetical protein [Bacteroidota bacterium]
MPLRNIIFAVDLVRPNGDIILPCAREEQAQFFDSLVQFTWLLDSLGNIKQEKLHIETAPQYFGAVFTERTVPGSHDYIMANQMIHLQSNRLPLPLVLYGGWILTWNKPEISWIQRIYTESGPWILKSGR